MSIKKDQSLRTSNYKLNLLPASHGKTSIDLYSTKIV